MSELRLRLLEDLHQRVRRLADAPWYDMHRQLALVIHAADGIGPRPQVMRDSKGRFVKEAVDASTGG